MSTMQEDLENDYAVQRSELMNHPEYDSTVLVTQYGWANKRKPTYWYRTEITPINNLTKQGIYTMKNYTIIDRVINVLTFIAVVVIWLTL